MERYACRAPYRRGTLVVLVDAGWMVQRCAADLTSRSLRERTRQARPSESRA